MGVSDEATWLGFTEASPNRDRAGMAAASVLRMIFDLERPCDERSSRKMQQVLSQRSEGAISTQRSKPQVTVSSPRDIPTHQPKKPKLRLKDRTYKVSVFQKGDRPGQNRIGRVRQTNSTTPESRVPTQRP